MARITSNVQSLHELIDIYEEAWEEYNKASEQEVLPSKEITQEVNNYKRKIVEQLTLIDVLSEVSSYSVDFYL